MSWSGGEPPVAAEKGRVERFGERHIDVIEECERSRGDQLQNRKRTPERHSLIAFNIP